MASNTPIINIFILGLCLILCTCVKAELPRFEHPIKPDGSLSILVVGDWGRKGQYNQSQVAAQMGKIGEKADLDFIISTGDNFYSDGLTGINDPAFEESFTNIYVSPSLQKQWYIVLGNHDYRGDALAQLDPILTHKDKRWFCKRSYVLNTDVAEFFFVDTTPFSDKYFSDSHTYDWRGILPREEYLSNLLKDLDIALKQSSSNWKIVVGHHTIKSGGNHGNTVELVNRLLPVLQANQVDLYINGHDHCLEHITTSESPIQFLTSGGGSKAWKNKFHPVNKDDLKFYYDGQGFMTMKITQTDLHFQYYDISGNILHQSSLPKGYYPM